MLTTHDEFGVLQRTASHSSAFLAFNSETRRYATPGIDGLIAYRPAGRRQLLQISEVFAAAQDKPALLRQFRDWTASERRHITAVQLPRDDAELYAANGFVVNQMGASYS